MEKEAIVEKASGKGIAVFLLGSALAAGAAFFMSRACRTKGSTQCARVRKAEGAESEPGGIYCAVPEGADICYPEQ